MHNAFGLCLKIQLYIIKILNILVCLFFFFLTIAKRNGEQININKS